MSLTPAQRLAAATLLADAIEPFRGATLPNPPVAAAVYDAGGQLLGVGLHRRAGEAHAEVDALEAVRRAGHWEDARCMVVTLEPCNHTGRTPPCTEAILASPIREVIFLHTDPYPHGSLGGAERLRAEGLRVEQAEPEVAAQHAMILGPFLRRAQAAAHGKSLERPWVTVKTVWRNAWASGGAWTMVPPLGQKTFASEHLLRLAHRLRRQADAVLTGSGTVLADAPLFNVRHVPDHPRPPKRWLAVLDRRGRVPREYFEAARQLGFKLIECKDATAALRELADRGVHEVLVEAGPELSGFMLRQGLWDVHVEIKTGPEDQVTWHRNLG